jgi:hypothetical protein
MFSREPRQSTRLCYLFIVASLGIFLVAGCSGTSAPATSAPGATRAPATVTGSPASNVKSGPRLTAAETTWLSGVEVLGKRMNAAMGAGSSAVVTSKSLHAVAKQLGGCNAEFSRLGHATHRLQPVSAAAKQGCHKYQEAAKCFTKATPKGSEECLPAVNAASSLFSKAQAAAEGIKGSVS